MLLQKLLVVLRYPLRIGKRAATPALFDRGAAADRVDHPIFLDREAVEVTLSEPVRIGAQLLRHRKIDIAGLFPIFGNVFQCLVVIDFHSRSKQEGSTSTGAYP